MAQTFFDVRSQANRISLFGDLRLNVLDSVTGALHNIAVQARYPDITIDFSNLTSFVPSVAPPLAAYARFLTQQHKTEYSIVQPKEGSLSERMRRVGLFHFFDFRKFEKPRMNSSSPVLMQFYNMEDCIEATNKIVNNTIRTVKLGRDHIAALEWAVTEITDNVLNHSRSPIGGFAIYRRIPKTNIVEFTVADCGIGIARSLNLRDEVEAVTRAIQEGVTRNTSTNQGNGLYGTFKLACASSCHFSLRSKHGALYVDRGGEVHSRRSAVPFQGTLVTCQIDCDAPDLIERAFVFKGQPHTPAFDYIEKLHEYRDDEGVWVVAADVCKTFGSRESGREARQYLENLLCSVDGRPIHVDFQNVPVISSSFADEVFGKLFVTMGPMKFMRLIKIENTVSTVEGLIGRAIEQRSKTGL